MEETAFPGSYCLLPLFGERLFFFLSSAQAAHQSSVVFPIITCMPFNVSFDMFPGPSSHSRMFTSEPMPAIHN